MSSLAQLSSLTGLTSLDISKCYKVTSLVPLSTLTNIQALKMDGCDSSVGALPLALAHLHS